LPRVERLRHQVDAARAKVATTAAEAAAHTITDAAVDSAATASTASVTVQAPSVATAAVGGGESVGGEGGVSRSSSMSDVESYTTTSEGSEESGLELSLDVPGKFRVRVKDLRPKDREQLENIEATAEGMRGNWGKSSWKGRVPNQQALFASYIQHALQD
jgi:hypothetical protein